MCNSLQSKRLGEALNILQTLISETSSGDIANELDNITIAYKAMLSYTIDGIADPERDKVYQRLIRQTLRAADIAKQRVLIKFSGWNTFAVRKQMEKSQLLTSKTIVETVDDLIFKADLDRLLNPDCIITHNPESEEFIQHKGLIKNIFNHLWLTDYYGEAEENLIDIFSHSGRFEWYEIALFTSAITLSLLRVWQPEKVIQLFKIYHIEGEQVSERAMVGIILNLYLYNNRISFYPEVIDLLQREATDNLFCQRFMDTVLQIIRSKETAILTKHINEEIVPKFAKWQPKLEERLELNNILNNDSEGNKNPEWDDIFKDNEEMYQTMEELAKLNSEGADVYMSTFSMLKNFDFFSEIENWFLPFYPDHEIINEIFSDEVFGSSTDKFAETLYKVPFLCNSDKYSVVSNIKFLKNKLKDGLAKTFKMEIDNIEEMNNEENILEGQSDKFKIFVTQYVQDLYRFFKLSPYKNEFEDVFSDSIDIYNTQAFDIVGKNYESVQLFADYFFDKNFFNDAITLLKKQSECNPENTQLYEKIGYCYQKLDNYNEALNYYCRAEILDRKLWTIKKIALCYRKLGKKLDAFDYYLQAHELEPNNSHTSMMVGHSCLSLKNYSNALTYYFKVEFDNPDNVKILRPIAYCYLAKGQIDDSSKYYQRIPTEDLTSHDYINIGYIALSRRNRRDAAEFWHRSIAKGDISIENLVEIVESDKQLLSSINVDINEIPLLLDYITML